MMMRSGMKWLCGWLVFCLLLGTVSFGLAEDMEIDLTDETGVDEDSLLELEDEVENIQDDIMEDTNELLLDIDSEIKLEDLNGDLDDLEEGIFGSYTASDAMIAANNTYIINGKSVYPTMVADPGNGQCWAYANSIYSVIWGVRFDSSFIGSSGTGYNMLRNLGDGDRTLNSEHLRNFISQSTLGAVIRIGGCTSSCSHFNDDGLSCGHSGHSLILVAKNDSGFTTIERVTGPGRREETWTWDGFCNYYSRYPYIKYIKWPNAPAYGGSQPVVTASTLQFTNVTYPKTFRINTTAGFALSGGMLESNYDLRTLKTQIFNSSGNVISSGSVSISGKSYAIRNLDTYSSNDNGVKFSYIQSAGDYKWVLTATDSGGRTLTLEMPFTAVSSGSTYTSTASKQWKQSDTTAPTITNVKVSSVTSEGYTVSCTVSDNVGVNSVKFPTWTEQNGQDDLIWHNGSLSGGKASFKVKVSDHKNEYGCTYITHIYAYDAAGNSTCYGVTVSVPKPRVSISECKVTVKDRVYTGKPLSTALTVKYGSKTLTKGTDYTATYANNRAIGKATVTIKGKGKYTGTKKVTYKILPHATRLSKLTARSKAFTATWKRGTANTGYVIQYSPKSNFSSAKEISIRKPGTLSVTIKSLVSGRRYYVRVRTYKKVNSSLYCYSAWSAAKSVVVK